jgi:hypothetical protein
MSVPIGPLTPPPGSMSPREARLAAGLGPEQTGPETILCTRCGHSARSHPDSSSCSHRVRWWRRCPCAGYTGFDSADRP